VLLAGIPMLDGLQPAQLTTIAAAMRPRQFRAGSTIIRQGGPGDRFFLIARGSAEVLRTPTDDAPRTGPTRRSSRPVLVATLGPGDYFGELALLNQSPRAATVRALTTIDTLELSAEEFNRLVSPPWQLRQRMARAAALRDTLAEMPLFKDMRPSERDLLMSRVQEEAFEAGQTVVQQGDPGERFYVIRDGSVQVLQANAAGAVRAVAELGAGDFFGELALLYSAPRNATVLTLAPVRVWSLSRRDFDDVLRHYLRMDSVVQATAERRLETVRSDPPTETAPEPASSQAAP
jgi:CRP-like cAMP-binding protein